jgi:hypothetical protein
LPYREQKVWSAVKRFCSCEGTLYSVCQQIIKTLILNSHKFKKVRFAESYMGQTLRGTENTVSYLDKVLFSPCHPLSIGARQKLHMRYAVRYGTVILQKIFTVWVSESSLYIFMYVYLRRISRTFHIAVDFILVL